MKKLSVQRPFFLSWLGLYYNIYHSTTFIALDDCIFTKKKDFRSLWHRNTFDVNIDDDDLTIPIHFLETQRVNDLKISTNIRYIRKHLTTIKFLMASKPYTQEVLTKVLEPVYKRNHKNLIDFNMDMIFAVCNYLSIPTDHIKRSSELNYSVSDSVSEMYFQFLEKENCDVLFVDETLGEILSSQEDVGGMMELDEQYAIRQGEQDRLVYLPIKKILPPHYNIVEILCEYGTGAINLLKQKG